MVNRKRKSVEAATYLTLGPYLVQDDVKCHSEPKAKNLSLFDR
jgi:hypothetical protein